MPTGRSGVLYPPVMSRALRDAGEGFLECAPRADDIWLYAVAVRTRTPVVLTPRAPRNFGIAPVRAPGGLSIKNIVGGGNDAQITATYGADDIAAIAASSG